METAQRAAADGIDTELPEVSVQRSEVQVGHLALLPMLERCTSCSLPYSLSSLLSVLNGI